MPFTAAVEFDNAGHPKHVRFDSTCRPQRATLAHWARHAKHASVQLVTDGLASLAAVGRRPLLMAPLWSARANRVTLGVRVSLYLHCPSENHRLCRLPCRHSKFERYPSRCLAGPQYRNKRLSNMRSWIARLLHNCARNKPCLEAGFRAGIVRTS